MKKNSMQCQLALLSSVARPIHLVAALALVPAFNIWADELDTVVVSATRSAQNLSDAIAHITFVDKETIEKSGAASIEEVLARVPGIQMTRNGGAGANTEIFFRGANRQHTAVYIDGIRIDAQNGSGGAQWESIPLESVERIEIMGGAASALYGSDAMAGTIQIFTQRGEQGWQPYVSWGAGTHQTQKATAGLRGAHGQWDYALGLSYAKSDGFDAQPGARASARNPDKDGYRRQSANARLGLQLGPQHRLDVTAMTSDSDAGYDAKPQLDDRSIRNLDAYGLQWHKAWNGQLTTRLALSESRSVYETRTASPSHTTTTLRNYLLTNEVQSAYGRFSVMLERREDALEHSGLVGSKTRDKHQNAWALGYLGKWDAHSLQLNIRRDEDSDFGAENTASAGYGWNFAQHWKATASVGTGFRVPTLYQRFSAYGDASLQPEESLSKEIGLRWQDKAQNLSLVAYRNHIENMVTYESGGCGSRDCYLNVDEATLEGMTLSGQTLLGRWKLSGAIDFQNPRNAQTGRLLQRRSQRFTTWALETDLSGWNVGVEWQAASRRFNNDTEAKKSLGGYALWNVSASKQVGKDFTLNARIDNALDRDYTLANQYATAGRTLWLGVKWMPSSLN